MNDNNDFLKSYKEKTATTPDVDKHENDIQVDVVKTNNKNNESEHMSFKEKSTFNTPRRYSSNLPPSNNDGGNNTIKRMAIASLITFLVLMLIIFLFYLFMNKTEVMDFTGWTKNDFSLWASDNNVKPQFEDQYNDSVDANLIISQSILPDTRMKKGDFIKVIVSLGPDLTAEFSIPDFINMTKDEIKNWESINLMSKVRYSSEFSETIPLNNVIKFEINDDNVIDKVKRDTPIYFIISKGSQGVVKKEILIPDFRTLGVSGSVIFAQEKGLYITIEERYDDYVPSNSIISQSIEKDAIAYAGDNLNIIVSLGKKRIMLSFKQVPKDQAMSKASQLGVSVTISERYSSSSEGRMIWQSIEVGQEITNDTQLELKYSLGSKIQVGNYVGTQKINIDQWLTDINKYGARLSTKTTYTQNEAAAGIILQQSVKETFVYRDTVINIVVSSGNTLYTPDFVAPSGSGYDLAITREKAEEMANNVRIILIFVEETNSNRLPGEVWYQNVAAGSEIKEGSTVTLKYNPVKQTLLLPNFIGKSEAEVRAMTEFDNLLITFVEGDMIQPSSSIIYLQSIIAYTTVPYGSEITLTISPVIATPTVIPTSEPTIAPTAEVTVAPTATP